MNKNIQFLDTIYAEKSAVNRLGIRPRTRGTYILGKHKVFSFCFSGGASTWPIRPRKGTRRGGRNRGVAQRGTGPETHCAGSAKRHTRKAGTGQQAGRLGRCPFPTGALGRRWQEAPLCQRAASISGEWVRPSGARNTTRL